MDIIIKRKRNKNMAKDKTLNIPTEYHTQIDAGSKVLKNDLLKVENKEYSIESGIAAVCIIDNTGIHVTDKNVVDIFITEKNPIKKDFPVRVSLDRFQLKKLINQLVIKYGELVSIDYFTEQECKD